MKRIILVGKAASGKDYFKNYLVNGGLKPSISHTTRPMRDGEVDGKDYHFISEYRFNVMKSEEQFFENKEFNGWQYGTSNQEVYDSEVFIFTPSGINDLPDEFLDDSVIIYFNVLEEYRMSRLLKRSDADSVNRRIKADEDDFRDFNNFDLEIVNPYFSPLTIVNMLNLNLN